MLKWEICRVIFRWRLLALSSFLLVHSLGSSLRARAQVSEDALHTQAELGGGWIDDGWGGYGALALGLEFHPAYQLAARYQLELDQVHQTLNHRPLVEVRFQLNVLELIPWVSVAAGMSYGDEDLGWTGGGALGADLRLSPTQFLSCATRFSHPGVWTLGLAFGGRIVFNDPFAQ